MAILKHLLLISALVPLVLSYPFYPPTCYTKVLSMAREVTQWGADLKRDPETSYCMAHMPYLYIDVHNGCVMHKMSTYIRMVEDLRQRRCAYTRDVWKLGVTMRQLFIIMSERCHGPSHLICDVRPIWVCYWCPGMTDLSVQPRPQCLGERTWCSQSLTALPWSADILDAEIIQPAHGEC